jgi:hypothetical protein
MKFIPPVISRFVAWYIGTSDTEELLTFMFRVIRGLQCSQWHRASQKYWCT